MAFLREQELDALGLGNRGEHVLISTRASIYGAEHIRIGSRVRIDDFCILSAGEDGFEIGSNVHIAAYASIIGAGRVTIGDFAGVSSRVSVYSSNDDYSGARLSGPTVPEEYKRVDKRAVHIGRHVIIGAGSVVLPGVTLHDGAIVGALTLIKRDCEAFTIYGGNPARICGARSRELLALEQDYIRSIAPST